MDESMKPYLVRAIYEWCCDQGYVPYLHVWVNEHTRVPAQFVQDAQITLNIGMNATHQLHMDNEWISFRARFGGVEHEIMVPMGHVMGIYARETGMGLMGLDVQAWQPASEIESSVPVADNVQAAENGDANPSVKKAKVVKFTP